MKSNSNFGRHILTNSQMTLRDLLRAGVLFELIDYPRGRSIIVQCASLGDNNVIEFLLRHPQFNLDIEDDHGRTALIKAVIRNSPEVVKRLIVKGSNLLHKDHNNHTALDYALNLEGNSCKEMLNILANPGGNTFFSANKKSDDQTFTNIISGSKVRRHVKVTDKYNTGLTNLHRAIIADFNNSVAAIMEKKFTDVNIKDIHGRTPLFYAVILGNVDVISYLCRCKTNLNTTDKFGKTALIYAVMKRNIDVINALFKLAVFSNLRLDVIDQSGKSALDYAITNNDMDIVKLLLEKGAILTSASLDFASEKLSSEDYELLKSHENKRLRFIDLLSEDENKEDELLYLLSQCKDRDEINQVDSDGKNLLMHAIERGYKALVDCLISNPLFLKGETDNMGKTVLIYAVENGYSDIVYKLLPSFGGGVWTNYCSSSLVDNFNRDALMYAAMTGQVELFIYLLSKRSEFNMIDSEGNSILIYAAKNSNLDIICALFLKKHTQKTIDINIKDRDGVTPLMWATRNENSDLVSLLLSLNADISIKDQYGFSAIDYTADPDIRKSIQNYKRESTVEFFKNYTCGKELLSFAIKYKTPKVVEKLLVKKIDLSVRDNEGRTPLINAVIEGDFRIVKLILERCDVNPQIVNMADNKGCKALDYSKGNDVKELLVDFIAKHNLANETRLSETDLTPIDSLNQIHTSFFSMPLKKRPVPEECSIGSLEINSNKVSRSF